MQTFRYATYPLLLFILVGQLSGCKTGPSIDPASLKGIVLDDTQGARHGPWIEANARDVRHLGTGFIQDHVAHKGEVSIVYTPAILEDGYYDIILISPPGDDRARNVPVTVAVKDSGKVTQFVDQRNQRNKGFLSLGIYLLPKGSSTTVTIANSNTVGNVVADGIQFLRVNKGRSGT